MPNKELMDKPRKSIPLCKAKSVSPMSKSLQKQLRQIRLSIKKTSKRSVLIEENEAKDKEPGKDEEEQSPVSPVPVAKLLALKRHSTQRMDTINS